MRNRSSQFTHARRGICRRSAGFFSLLAIVAGLFAVSCGTGLAQLTGPNQPGQYSATLTWNAHPNPAVTGYRVYHGTSSRAYFENIAVGNTTSSTFYGLDSGVTHYFAISAYNLLGAESPLSEEIIVFQPRPAVAARLNATRQPVLTVTGLVGHSYEVQATRDFQTWTPLGIVAMGTNGTLDFTDTGAAGLSHRFYRTREVLP